MSYSSEQEHAELLRYCTQNLHLHTDKSALTRVHDSISTIRNARSLRVQSLETQLRKLARTHTQLSNQHRELVTGHDSAKHGEEVVDLDSKKFRVAKNASDLEQENEKLQAELTRLERRLAQLDEEGLEGNARDRRQREADDPTILRLWLYRSLGIELGMDVNGNYNKAIVNGRDNGKGGDVHVVNFDGRMGKWWYGDYLWGCIKD